LPSRLQDAAAAYLAGHASGPPAIIPQTRSREIVTVTQMRSSSRS
jgi:hypothetical protein